MRRQNPVSPLVWLALVTAGCRACPSGTDDPKDLAQARAVVERMQVMVTGTLDERAADAWSKAIASGEMTHAKLVDEMLRTPAFGRLVLPSLVFGPFLNVLNYYAVPAGYILKSTSDDAGDPIFHLREPCSANEAERVRPWWAPDEEVLVCPDSHRPNKWTVSKSEQAYKSEMPLSCDSQVGSPEKERSSVCGCGPNLIRCLRDFDHYLEMHEAMKAELVETTAHVYDNDLSPERLFTGTETFRVRTAELLYRRQQIGAEQIAEPLAVLEDLSSWPEEGRWAARREQVSGQHAGLLTAPQLLHWLPDRRQRQRGFYEVLWCKTSSGFGATTEKIWEVSQSGNLAFVHEKWKRLASMEFCTGCHARMDYGFQFFLGYPDSRASTHFFTAAAATGKGPLYGDDIDDPRGDAALTPAGFAALAVKQPEFADCMARKITDHVLADEAEATDQNAVRDALMTQGNLRAALKVALLRWMERMPTQEPIVRDQATPADGKRLSPALRAALDEHCVECHFTETFVDPSVSFGAAFDFRPDALPQALILRMLDQVAFEKMPLAPNILPRHDRAQLLQLLLRQAFPDPTARAEAENHFVGRMRGPPVQGIDHAFRVVEQRAGAKTNVAWGLLERATFVGQWTYTPNYAAATAMHALQACKRGPRKKDLEACISDATAPERFVREFPR